MFDLFGDLSSWPSCIEMARAASGFLASPSNTHGCNILHIGIADAYWSYVATEEVQKQEILRKCAVSF